MRFIKVEQLYFIPHVASWFSAKMIFCRPWEFLSLLRVPARSLGDDLREEWRLDEADEHEEGHDGEEHDPGVLRYLRVRLVHQGQQLQVLLRRVHGSSGRTRK